MRKLMLLTVVLCLSAVALAAEGTGTITVTLTGTGGSLATCTFNATAWSWGASNPTPSPGRPVGLADLSALNISKHLDACTPALFQAVVEGAHWTALTLVQTNHEGAVLARVTASSVFAVSLQDGGTVGQNPSESVSFAFGTIKIEEDSGSSFCWNVVTHSTC